MVKIKIRSQGHFDMLNPGYPLEASIAKRVQLLFHAQLSSQSFLEGQLEHGLTSSCLVEEMPFYEYLKNLVPNDLKNVEHSNWVKFKGTRYATNMLIVLHFALY